MRFAARLWEIFAVAAVVGMTSGVCLAAEESGESAEPLHASGVVASIDALGGIVTLKEQVNSDLAVVENQQPTSYLVDANTVVSQDTQKRRVTDLRVGDAVTVEYATKDSKNVATSITIQSPTAASSESAMQAVQPAATSY